MVGGSRDDLMQENHFAVPVRHSHGQIDEPVEFFRKPRQFMKMGGEQCPRAIFLVQMLDHRPGDGKTVESGGAAADFVEDHERVFAGLVEDRGGLDHFDHEGRTAAREIVGRADPRIKLVDDPDMGALRGHERAHLGKDGDQCILTQIGRFAGHVRAGHDRDPAASAGGARKLAAVPGKGLTLQAQRRLDDGMPPAFDLEGKRAIDLGPCPIRGYRQFGESGRDIDRRYRGSEPLERRLLRRGQARQGSQKSSARGRARPRRRKQS